MDTPQAVLPIQGYLATYESWNAASPTTCVSDYDVCKPELWFD